jgi:hypothetical protein
MPKHASGRRQWSVATTTEVKQAYENLAQHYGSSLGGLAGRYLELSVTDPAAAARLLAGAPQGQPAKSAEPSPAPRAQP